MASIYDTFRDTGIIPVVALEDVSKAESLAHALVKGGLGICEVTFRTSCAPEAIEAMIKAEPALLVGAGTVLSVEQAERACKAGSKFIVSPGYNPELVDWCLKNNIAVVPGVATASEITACVNKGLSHLKLFPARTLGGAALIDDFKGPFPGVLFMPTGGVSPENLCDYLKRKNVFCAGGTWMVKKDLINSGKWEEITRLCAQAVQLVKEGR